MDAVIAAITALLQQVFDALKDIDVTPVIDAIKDLISQLA